MARIFLIFSFFLFSTVGYSQSVDFTFTSTTGTFCTPASIQFTQTATGNPTGFIWNLGNGLRSFTPNPSTSYINPGTYTVKLIALFPSGPLEISKAVTISPSISPVAAADRPYICQPGAINFTAPAGSSITSYEWNFGDSSGVVSNPIDSVSHTFTNFGEYNVIVKATNAAGCVGEDTIQIKVTRPAITAAADPLSGCIPANTTFSATAEVPVGGSVSTFAWDWGDGTTGTNTSTGSANHNYTTPGIFSPKLSITTDEGCTNSFDFPVVAFGTPPTNHVAFPAKTVICGSETARFVAKATNAKNYRWDFGDGTFQTVSDTAASHKYETLGIKDVVVTPFFNGCAGTPISFQIEIVGVIAKFIYSNTCSDKTTFAFNNSSLGNKTSVEWNFGDTGSIVTTTNATHTFPPVGQFTTQLTITDSITGCIDTLSRPIYTATPRLINPDSSICKNTPTTFVIENNYLNSTVAYKWTVVGKSYTTSNVSSTTVDANILGNFNNAVIINNIVPSATYCQDTLQLDHSILVRGPQLDFTVPASVCFTDTVNIQNNSRPFVPGDTVVVWHWNYGNSLSNDTIYQPEPIVYNAPRPYLVELTGIDINGCQDSLIRPVVVSPLPFLQVFPAADTLCSGQSDTLFAFHNSDVTWSPAAGLSCIDCDTVIANPSVTTQYIVQATTPANCSIRDSILITVIPPFTASSPNPNVYICQNEQDTITVSPRDKIIVWSPSAGLSNPTVYNPVVRPSATTTYTATLQDSAGCFTSSTDVTVFINSLPMVDAGPDQVFPFNTPFTLSPVYSNNVRSYLWTPPAQLNCTTCPSPRGYATNTNTYTIQVTSDSGCVSFDSITIGIECKDANILMPGAFSPNNDNLNDFYYPITRGVKLIARFTVYNREGQTVYEQRNFVPNNKTFAWNGYFKGEPLSAKAYVYVIEAICESGEKLTKGGSFLLLR